jgi:hypothetical protein
LDLCAQCSTYFRAHRHAHSFPLNFAHCIPYIRAHRHAHRITDEVSNSVPHSFPLNFAHCIPHVCAHVCAY